jgi:hypothetical protein
MNRRSLINLDNLRLIENCGYLCYTNSAIHLLNSLVEFREAIFNTNTITNSNLSNNPVPIQEDISILFYKFKKIFLLLNKRLSLNNEHGYISNDIKLECKRSNNLYTDLYKDLLKKSIIILNNNNGTTFNYNDNKFIGDSEDPYSDNGNDAITDLNNCGFSFNNLSLYLDLFRDISNNLFSYTINSKSPFRKYNFWHDLRDPSNIINKTDIVLNKYLILSDNYSIFNSYPKTNNYLKYSYVCNGINYILLAAILGNQTHYWTIIHDPQTDPNNFIEVNDLGPVIRNNYILDTNKLDDNGRQIYIRYALYVREDATYQNNYSLDTQINNLASISHEINTQPTNNLNKLNHKIISKLIKLQIP